MVREASKREEMLPETVRVCKGQGVVNEELIGTTERCVGIKGRRSERL